MDSHTRLDYVLFHLTPTRTRCDLVIFAGKSNEKLAYGLLEPFIAHLKSAKDQISKGGYSVTLRPPSPENSYWFTKGTLQRFVRFVSTPEVLERFVTIEREISQLENTIKSFEASNGESNDSSDLKQEENSKDRLNRVVETRQVVLWKEQAMVYARALAAGFDLDNLNDLLSFSDAFGASRLREACINFRDLCKNKNEDRLWVDEIAAMQAIMQPDLSLMGTSGIVLAGDDIDPDTVTCHDSSDANQENGFPASQSPGLMQNPWAGQFPPHLRNFQGPVYQQMSPYQGYGFPGMQVAPPYYPANMPWPADHRDRKSSSKKKSKGSKARKSEKEGHDEKTEPSDSSESSSETDSSSDRSHRKKNGKKSSRKVVIRNINYISSKRDDEKNSASETSSSDEKHYKSTARGHIKDNESKKENKGSEGWDAFQQLLLKEDSDSNVPETKTAPTEEEYLSAKISEKQPVANDAFIVTEMGSDGYHPAIRRGNSSIPEESQFAQRSEEIESYALVSMSNDATHSVIKSHTGDDWFVSKKSDETVNQEEVDHFRLINGDNAEKRSKDVVIDDSLMIQGRLADEYTENQLRTNISMVSDIMEAREAVPVPQKISESQGFCEPDELYMALDRDTVVEQTVPSWNPEIDFENNVLVKTPAKKSDFDACADLNANEKGSNKKTGNTVTKNSGRDARTRTAGGPMRRGKPETTPGPRRSTFGSKTATPKGQFEKDKERRKRMEELLIRRQKRIAERGGDISTSGRKSVTSSLTSDKLKIQSSVKETKKPKPVLRSSTIDRLAVAKTTKNSSTPQPRRETSKPKGTNTNNGSQKTRDVHLKKLSANKINPSEKKPGNGDPTGVKEAKNSVTEIKFDEADDSKDIKELHVTSTTVSTDTDVGMVVQSLQAIPSDKTVDKSLEVDAMPEIPLAFPEDVKVFDELSVHPVPESPRKHLNSGLNEGEGIANGNISGSPEISMVQESTPLTTSEIVLESTQSRKKWDGPEKSTKAKGFRKLLMFGRKS